MRRAALVILLAGCAREEGRAAPRPLEGDGIARGDVVVVERGAADFFQGRVLAVAEAKLKVQADADGEPVTVSRSDAYRLGAGPSVVQKGEPLVCGDDRARWVPCLGRGLESGGIGVDLPTGSAVLPATRIVVPSSVTALNVRRYFEKLEVTRKFAGETSRAGAPKRPAGWLPEPKEPVLAHREDGWYPAHVAALGEDGGVRVVFRGNERPEMVPSAAVVPVPPFVHTFARGDYALVRGETEGVAWRTARIEALGPADATLVGPDGARFRASLRELVPLVGAGER